MCPEIDNEVDTELYDLENPYADFCYHSDIECDYTIPTPDFFSQVLGFNVPSPVSESNQKYTYTLKNGQVLELDHPLPDGFPIDMISSEEPSVQSIPQIEYGRDCSSMKEVVMYAACAALPISGLIMYLFTYKKNPKVAERIRNVTLSSFVTWGTVLLLLL
ncbi:hypothetical protein TVAG_268040 [Trichomonas vaginalis G3]|uniref:Uncharacterized protein n=1 Tax=Trichomonas vaginalis (strain ATCC PRA-98 / G3) TaxID=412133 RepID=A2DLF3_TRIV3|nr:hypothetical protein TVAGG3_0013800 [Trichomonas vaginalis G3]EAY18771.1 hypothetical protein TVAG_268040 [Trichomonas vaginalis G3]KAI5539293.1 hypothetical protein TVAGG3_0013800 [Trichomonas vaginalis G3]|eukprot:XP_001579757.1 hypothetical protein [Trichomonas vaginalis G3]